MENKIEQSRFGYLARNTLLFTISSFGSKLLSFLLVPLYTNVLSTEDYGTADLITTTSSLLVFVVTLCIADAVMRFAIDLKTNQDEILRFGFKVTVIGCSSFGIIILGASCFNIISWPKYCYIFLFLHLLLLSLHTLCSNYLRAIDKIRQVSISGLIITLVTIVCNILFLVVVKIGVVGYMLSILFGVFIALVYEVYHCGKFKIFIFGNTCNTVVQKEMIKYSVPLAFNGVGWWVNSSIDKYFILALCGVAVNGIYSVSYKIPMILTTCQQIFSQAWSLSAIKEFDAEDKEVFFSKSYNTYNAFLIVICSLLILTNIPIARLLFAKDFFSAWKFSSFLLISVIFSALSSFLGGIISAAKKSKSLAISTVISALINIILNACLIPTFGAIGAAFSTAISFFSIWIIRLVAVRKQIKWKMNIGKDLFAYCILFVQAFIESQNEHLYILQLLMAFTIVILYQDSYVGIINKLLRILKDRSKSKSGKIM